MLASMLILVLVATSLVMASAETSAVASRIGAPLLLVCLAIGLVAGEDSVGGIQFDNAEFGISDWTDALQHCLHRSSDFLGSPGLDHPSARTMARAGRACKDGIRASKLGRAFTDTGTWFLANWHSPRPQWTLLLRFGA